MQTRLRRIAQIQLYGLLCVLPFEFFFGDRSQSLATSVKLQACCLIGTWSIWKAAGFRKTADPYRQRLQSALPARLLGAGICFLGVQIVAALVAPDYQTNALKAAAKTVVGAVLALAAADLTAERSNGVRFRDARTCALFAITIAGVLTTLLGLGDFFGIGMFTKVVAYFQNVKYLVGDRIRFVSTMEYPNTTASFLSIALCALVTLALGIRSKRRPGMWTLIATAGVIILGVGLALTYSRGAIGATIIAIGCAAWFWRRWYELRHAALVLGVCFAVLFGAALSAWSVRRQPFSAHVPGSERIAQYGFTTDAQIRALLPGHEYQESMAVQNLSAAPWRRSEFGIACRWHDVGDNRTSPLIFAGEFTADLAPGQRSKVNVSFTTPTKEGEYVLIWFIVRRDGSIQELKSGYSPGIMCIIQSGKLEAANSLSVKARGYAGAISEERRELVNARVPGRWDLWAAGARMFLNHPLLGTGPDSFRLMKLQFMDIPKGNETILANSLYLELLTGSGVLGLLSFLWLLWECSRAVVLQGTAVSASSGARAAVLFGTAYLILLLVHGTVDYFLKFTPTFLLFWVMLGILCSREKTG